MPVTVYCWLSKEAAKRSAVESLNRILPWVIRLLPDLVALFDADGDEARVIAAEKLILNAARHKTDLDLAAKHAGAAP